MLYRKMLGSLFTKCFGIGAILFFSPSVLAQTEIKFSNHELEAASTLMRPELNSVEINGKTGFFTPAPSLKYLKVEPVTFEIDPSFITNLVKLEFNHLKGKTPKVFFNGEAFEFDLPIEDQPKAIESRIGSISFQNVVITSTLAWETQNDGTQVLVLDSANLNGNITGSGLLRSKIILNGIKNLVINALRKQLENLVAKDSVQEAVQTGLLQWSKFYSGEDFKNIIPGSIQFYDAGPASGMSYQVTK